MSSLSSLYSASTMELMVAAPVETAVADALTASADRLPGLVLRYVTNVRPDLKPFFNEDVREQRTRRRSTKVHNITLISLAHVWLGISVPLWLVTTPPQSTRLSVECLI
jgi:hypothetical protein